MDDALLRLDFPGDPEKRHRLGENRIFLKLLGPEDEVHETGFVFERHESDPGGGSRTLAANDETGVAHTAAVSKGVHAAKWVYYSKEIAVNDLFDEGDFDKRVQKGPDLGERMANAFREGFQEGYQKVLIIGSDMYDLDASEIDRAFLELDEHDYVIGPAQDGGYYLMGMKTLHDSIFSRVDWSTEHVLNQTLEKIEGSKVKLLETKNDIDTYEDLAGITAFSQYLDNSKR